MAHGARSSLYINGNLYAVVTDLTWNGSAPRKELRGLDTPFPLELAATTVAVSGTLAVVKIIGDGGLQGAGVMANQTDITSEKYVSLLLIDQGSDTVMFQADYAQITNEAWNVPAKGLVKGQITFSALSYIGNAR